MVPWFPANASSWCSHVAEEQGVLVESLLKEHYHEAFTLIIKQVSGAPPPHSITAGIRILTYESGGEGNADIQTMALSDLNPREAQKTQN